MPANKFEVSIVSEVSSALALRDDAGVFFDILERRRESQIEIDFSDVETITRSFAHEYMVRKGKSSKTITETNVPVNVKKMFIAAMDYRKEPRFPGLANISYVPL